MKSLIIAFLAVSLASTSFAARPTRQPSIDLKTALARAERYIQKHKIDLSGLCLFRFLTRTMDRLTLNQAALLLVRFFGFYLLFYFVLGLLDAPGYWMRSTFSHPHSATHSLFDTSYDVNLLMYYLREAAHFII